MPPVEVRRRDVLRFRFAHQELHMPPGRRRPTSVALTAYGVQDTGHDGASWALANRGAARPGEALALAWTIRGAPHVYPRSSLADVAAATAPFSEADAAKRVFDAAKPLKAEGIAVLDALRVVAGHLRDIARRPVVKGEASSELTGRLGPVYLRWCRPCQATHVYEMPFRLAALQAGLELEPGTSPPVLRRVAGLAAPMYERLGGEAPAAVDVVRNHLRFYGPTTAGHVATFLDARLQDVRAQWPEDVVEVRVVDAGGRSAGPPRFLLERDRDALTDGAAAPDEPVVRLLGPFDPYLQLRDRELLVVDAARRKALWPVLGRPGAVVDDGEVLGTWRPRASGRRLTVLIDPWSRPSPARRRLVEAEAERLAVHRGVELAGVTWA